MPETTMHELCKGFGALLSRSKVRSVFSEYGSAWQARLLTTILFGLLSQRALNSTFETEPFLSRGGLSLE